VGILQLYAAILQVLGAILQVFAAGRACSSFLLSGEKTNRTLES
jgi:hypothetical protein